MDVLDVVAWCLAIWLMLTMWAGVIAIAMLFVLALIGVGDV